MIAWKLLQAGGVGLFSGFAWPLPTDTASGAWVEVEPPLRPTFRGIHAIRTDALLDWLDEELYEIELAGEVIDGDPLLVASRGRLVRGVAGWDADAARELARSCVEVVRLAAEVTPAVQPVYQDCLALVTGARPEASPLAPGDDCPTTPVAIASNIAYVAAAVAGLAERARQQAWLLERIGVALVGTP